VEPPAVKPIAPEPEQQHHEAPVAEPVVEPQPEPESESLANANDEDEAEAEAERGTDQAMPDAEPEKATCPKCHKFHPGQCEFAS
jgi:hypothetical protein